MVTMFMSNSFPGGIFPNVKQKQFNLSRKCFETCFWQGSLQIGEWLTEWFISYGLLAAEGTLSFDAVQNWDIYPRSWTLWTVCFLSRGKEQEENASLTENVHPPLGLSCRWYEADVFTLDLLSSSLCIADSQQRPGSRRLWCRWAWAAVLSAPARGHHAEVGAAAKSLPKPPLGEQAVTNLPLT